MGWPFAGFNHHVLDGVLVCAVLFVAIYMLSFCNLKDAYYYFDPKHNQDDRLKDAGDFSPHFHRYSDLAKFMITLSVAAMAFLFNSVASPKPTNEFSARISEVAPIVVGLFGSATASLMGFIFSQTFFYEIYCHTPDHSSYTRWQYATCITFACVGGSAFLLGFLWLAINTFGS
jgi:hypothetical protein